MHVDMYINSAGPAVPDIHFDEMGEQDLRNVMAYLHVSLTNGLQQGLDEEMLAIIREWYDEVFTALAGVSEQFRERVIGGSVFPPDGPPARRKYLAIVKEASES